MSSAPLVLSDTAMVLLRRYADLRADYEAVCQELNDKYKYNEQSSHTSRTTDEDNRPEKRVIESHAFKYMIQAGDLLAPLAHEIWFLWRYDDIPVVRHLDWHLTFGPILTERAEALFVAYEAETIMSPTRETLKFFELLNFGESLFRTYQVYEARMRKDQS